MPRRSPSSSGATSSSCSYDSEEDRVQERLRQLEQRHRVSAQAAFEQDVLRQWRESRKHAARRGYVGGQGVGGRGDAGLDLRGEAWSRDGNAWIEEHRATWEEFERVQESLRGHSHVLVYDDVPWIPEHLSRADYLAYLLCVARERHHGDVKKAYAAMCLTWHPDKFQSRFMGFFEDGEEWQRVLARVNETFGAFRDAYVSAEK
jgi:hypothetical protein